MTELSPLDRDFLAAIGAGESAASFARRTSHSADWAKWESRKVRRLLGAATLEEAARMADGDGNGITRADFDALQAGVTRLAEAVAELGRAKPDEKQAAQQTVQARELDVKDHAKALGLTVADVERLLEEKEYARYKANAERLEKERADAARDAEDGGGVTDVDGDKSLGQKLVDGLGGIRNVR